MLQNTLEVGARIKSIDHRTINIILLMKNSILLLVLLFASCASEYRDPLERKLLAKIKKQWPEGSSRCIFDLSDAFDCPWDTIYSLQTQGNEYLPEELHLDMKGADYIDRASLVLIKDGKTQCAFTLITELAERERWHNIIHFGFYEDFGIITRDRPLVEIKIYQGYRYEISPAPDSIYKPGTIKN